MLTSALLVFAVCGRRTAERACQVRRGCERCNLRVNPTWEPGGYLLQQPAVPVRVAERCVRGVGTPLRIVPRSARLRDGDEAAPEAAAGVVEDVADIDAVRDELSAGRVDVVYRQE